MPAPRPNGSGILVLEPSWVLAFRDGDVELLRDHVVVLEDDHVVEVRPGPYVGQDRRLPLRGQLLVPGLISGHTHVASASATRGLIESGRLFVGIEDVVETLDDDDLDALTAYNLAEILRGGVTTQVEQSVSLRRARSYVRVAARWGVRGYPGGMVPGWERTPRIWFREDDQTLLDSVPETLAEIEANLRFARSINGSEDGRIRPMMMLHGPETHTPETMRAFADAARELGNGAHLHLASLARDSPTVERLWGKGPVQWLDDFGLYDMPLLGAHLNGWDAAVDAPFLAGKENFTYVHCPSGAGAGSAGALQPYPEALAAGINTAIGLDTHSNDLVENMKLAVLYGRLRMDLHADASPVPLRRPTVWDMVDGVTRNPARGLQRPDLGVIAPGAKADLVSIDVSGPFVGAGGVPREPLNNLLYASGLAVRHVMTDGRLQVEDGRILVADEQRLARDGARVAERVWGQLERDGWMTPTDDGGGRAHG